MQIARDKLLRRDDFARLLERRERERESVCSKLPLSSPLLSFFKIESVGSMEQSCLSFRELNPVEN